ncbi:MAB_1171c family putative transporter [Streptomyces albireticuli]|uniref:MAB_1171c family putative transporter n=1 Tax=Streptomyces albireticuli TaxID=1940 RepID=UPI00368F2365
MSADLATAGQELQYVGTGLLWLAVALRAGPSLRSPERRGLWLAVATAAVAMTLNLPEAARLAQRVTGSAHTTALIRNLSGVLSAGAVLYFVTATTGSRRLRNRLSLATAGALAALVVLDLAAPPHQEHTIPHSGAPVPSTAYWLVMITGHLAANISCAHLCWRYGRQADSRSLKIGLSTFGAGTAFAGLFWTGHLAHLLTGTEAPLPYLPFLMALHAILRATALLTPTLATSRQTLTDVTTIWRLHPLWRDLIEAAPHVAFTTPRPRLLEVLKPPLPYHLLAYRKIIETHDAILALHPHTPPGTPGMTDAPAGGTCRHAAPAGTPSEAGTGGGCTECAAVSLARALTHARRAKLAGQPPTPRPEAPHPTPPTTLTAETRFLLALARHYRAGTRPETGVRGPDRESDTTAQPAGRDRECLE